LTFTQTCSQPGSCAVGTNTLLAKVSGKIRTKARPWTLAGLLASMATNAEIQLTAKLNSMISPHPASAASGLPWGRKPRMAPKPNTSTSDTVSLARSPRTCPVSGAERAMGRLRKRSKMPVCTSVLRVTAVFRVTNSSAWTAIPGSTNCR
jgi:hypothetical protein